MYSDVRGPCDILRGVQHDFLSWPAYREDNFHVPAHEEVRDT